jgi:hypothetical protein
VTSSIRSASIRLALALRRGRGAPHGGEVRGERQDTLLVLLVHDQAIDGALALVVVLGLVEGSKLSVPIGFERVGHEPVVRIHAHVAAAGEVGLVVCSFDAPVA